MRGDEMGLVFVAAGSWGVDLLCGSCVVGVLGDECGKAGVFGSVDIASLACKFGELTCS